MATGTPRSPQRSQSPAHPKVQVELSYPNKKPLDELMDVEPVAFQTLKKGTVDKRLYFAENRDALAALVADKSVCGQVRMVYIDPPYATQTTFHSRKLTHAYEDVFETVEYVEFLRERLALLYRLLAEDGSIYVHIDDKMLFHVKLVMDEIFGARNYRNCITRKKCNPKNYTRKAYGNVADYILFYTKSDKYVWNRPVEPWTTVRAKEYQYVESETGRQFMKVPVHAPGLRNGETGKEWRGMMPPPGKHWQFSPATLDELDAKGEIYWSKNGNPRRKVYLDSSAGIPVQDIWMDFRDAHNQNIHITGYPTEKNFSLVKRLVEASSNPGDMVLDCFAGSGTTLVAADMLGRGWIGVDNSPESLRTILHRFAHGTEIMGDFVGAKAPKLPEAPTLFTMIDGGMEARANESHEVKRFTLLATDEEAVTVKDLLQQIPAKSTE